MNLGLLPRGRLMDTRRKTKATGEARVYAVEKAMMLVQCFSHIDEVRSLASLSRQSGLYKSTILRLTNSMCKMNFMYRDAEGNFYLGPEVRRLAESRSPQQDVAEIFRPVLRGLAAIAGEAALFYVRDGAWSVCLFRELAPTAAAFHYGEGERHPLHEGAAGEILRAFSPHSRDRELATVRKRGWSLSVGERLPNLGALSVPVFGKDKGLVGAITASTLLPQFTTKQREECRSALVSASRTLSSKLRSRNLAELLPHGH